MVSLEEQTARGIALFQVALAKGNLTAAATALKHLSELHGLNRPKDDTAGVAETALDQLSDGQLEALIAELSA